MASSHDKTYQTGIYIKQGGQELHIGNQIVGPDGTGAAVVVGSGSTPMPLGATFTPVAGASTVCNVTIQLQDGLGNTPTGLGPFEVLLWLSDAATGVGLTATAPSVGITITTGSIFSILTAAKALLIQTDINGKAVLQITDASRTLYFVAVGPDLGPNFVSAQLVTGNYG